MTPLQEVLARLSSMPDCPEKENARTMIDAAVSAALLPIVERIQVGTMKDEDPEEIIDAVSGICAEIMETIDPDHHDAPKGKH